MSKIHKLCFVGWLLISSEVTSAANLRLQVDGLFGALEKNVRAKLSTIESVEATQNRYFCARINDAIRTGLKALGYYNPTIDFNVHPSTTKKKEGILIARVSPGEPVLIGGSTVILRGDARADRDYLDLLAARPKVGVVLNHDDYENFKKSLSNLARCKGYFDSQFIKSQLGVAVKRRQAFWEIDYDSGKRYRFGDVTFEGSQIHEGYLQNLIPFKNGDYYQSTDLDELNRRLAATGWFNSVVVQPEFNKMHKRNFLPLHGVVSPRVENTVEIGLGYSTDIGLHVKMMWKKPWMNSHGHSLTSSANISASEQQLDFNYKIPLLKNPLYQYYLLQASFKRTDLNTAEQDSTALVISRYWDLTSSWQLVINLRWSLDHFTQANVTNGTMLLYPSVMISRTRSHGGLVPLWGDSQRYSIDYSNSFWSSDVDFSVFQVQNAWIRTLYNKHRFIMRTNLGWIETDNFECVPPDLRFFAGGDHSIRGYKYKSISSVNEKSHSTGTSKLMTASLEYQYNIAGKWWSAMFIDGGETVNDIRKSDFKIGAGVGVRWQSPVGAIKLDLAAPMSDKNKQNLELYIGLGHEL